MSLTLILRKELLVDIVFSIHAPAPPTSAFSQTSTHNLSADDGAGILGLVPHQLRGFLANFRNMGITGEAFDRCTGCSEKVKIRLCPSLSIQC